MKMTQLLTGAAVIALVAGAANAQTHVSVAGTPGTHFVKDDIFASEVTGDLEGDLIIDFEDATAPDGPFANLNVNENVNFDITLVNLRFTEALSSDIWDSQANLDGTTGANANCDFGDVARGGGNQQSTVGWTTDLANLRLCTAAAFNNDLANITLPVERIDESLPASVSLSFTPVGSANFTADSGSTDVVTYFDAYTPAQTAGTEARKQPTCLQLMGLQRLLASQVFWAR